MLADRYEEAAQFYAQLLETQPDNKSYTLNWCIALINSGKAAEAVNTLYKLSLENSDDLNVTRVLAWGLMASTKMEQAAKEYRRLADAGPLTAEDHLNAGYCDWIRGEVREAVRHFRQYLSTCSEAKKNEGILSQFVRDKAVLEANGLSENTFFIMVDLVG